MAVLQFPLAGLDNRLSYQNQRPFTTPRCLNVFPAGGQDQRERGGKRPGIDAAFYETLGSGNKINMLGNVTVFGADGLNIWEDTFDGTAVNNAWTTMASGFTGTFSTTNPAGCASLRADVAGALIRRPFNISDAADRGVEMFIKPHKGVHCGTYRLHLQLNNLTPAYLTDGYTFQIAFSADGSYTWTVLKYEASVLTTLGTGSVVATAAVSGWMKLQLRNVGAAPAQRLWASFRSAVHYNSNDTFNNGGGAGVYAGSGTGLSITGTGTSAQRCIIDTVRIRRYLSSTSQSRNKIAIAASNGSVYRETPMGTLEAKISGSYSGINVATDRNLSCSELFQKLYIADCGEVVCRGTDGSLSTATLTSASIGNWTNAGVDVKNHLLRMTACSDPTVILGAWKITSISGGGDVNLNLDPAYYPGTAGTVGSITFEVVRGPKVYTPSTSTNHNTSADALEMWVASALKGTIPARCEIVATYLDRMILAAPADNPQQIYFSRAGQPRDWLVGGLPSDTSQAVADAFPEPIKAVIPFGNDYCVVGTTNKLWRYIGDPGYGGQRRNISQNVGIVGKQAYCHGPGGELYFMSRDGLYVLPPGAGGDPESLSRERLPRELLHLDSQIFTVQLGYSRRYRGVMIWLTHDPMGENSGTSYAANRMHWFFSLGAGGFWPVVTTTTFEPCSSVEYEGHSDEDSGLLIGGRDGIVRMMHDRFERDGADDFDAYVTLGPAPLGTPGRIGILARLKAVLAEDSDDVALRIYSGTTPEEAVTNSTSTANLRSSTIAVAAGASAWHDPRITDAAYVIQVLNKTSGVQYPWSFENITVDIRDGGMARLT